MATSSSTNFEQSRDEIIRDALAKVGAVGPDETPSGPQLLHAARALNRIVKSLDPEGNSLWRVVERTATSTDGTASFSPASDVIAVDEPMNYKRSGENARTPIRAMSRDDYMNIGDRTIEGVPAQFYVSEALSGLTVYLYPVPDATGDTITYSAVLRGQDFDTGADTPDFDPAWTSCLVYGLAADLCFDYGKPQMAMQLRSVFEAEKSKLIEAGTEHGHVTLVPFGSYGGW